MDRKDIFNRAAAQADNETGLSLRQYAEEIENQIKLAEKGFTVNPDGPKALNPMLDAFNGVIAAGIGAMRAHGAYSRTNGLIGNNDTAAFTVLDEERNRQDSFVTPGFEAQRVTSAAAPARPTVSDGAFTLSDEIVMMSHYLNTEVFAALDAGDDVKASNGIRKVAAMALRGSEHPRL